MAQLITWSERLSVGIPRIDAQHQTLVEMINQLHAGVVAYTLSHFAAEEALMNRSAYPGYERHKAEHDKLTAQAKVLQEKARTAKSLLTLEVAKFLQHWLIDHIASQDKAYSAHLLAAGVK
jgi:hemerythrin